MNGKLQDMLTHGKLEIPSPEEEAEINRGTALDRDTWVLSDEEWAKVRPADEIDPDIVRAWRALGKEAGAAKQFHVIPRERGWAVRKVGTRMTEVFDTKSEAVSRARDLASHSQLEWVEYRRDGTVRDIHRPSSLERRQARR